METTIKVKRESVDALFGIRGWMDYTRPKTKHTLNDALDMLIKYFRDNNKI